MIATNRFNVQMARQPKRGVYPDAPTFFFECTGNGALNSPVTVSELVITDGDIWSKSRQRITQVAPGGSPEIVCQPNGLGAWLYAMLGAVSSTPGSPDLHVFTPVTDLSTVPYWLIWTFFDGEWHLFRDCQIVGGQITLGVDSTWAVVTPTIIGMKPVEKAGKPTEAIEETEDFNWLDGEGHHFIGGDPPNALHIDLPTDAATADAALTALKTAWNAHCAVATGLHHKAADAVNVLTYTTPTTDESTRIAACKEARVALLAHFANTTAHYFADVLNVLTHADPTNDATVLTFLQELIGEPNTPGAFNRHLGARAGARSFTLVVDRAAAAVPGESVAPYAVQYKRGTIQVAQDLLLEDFELVNLALFGDPNPSVGTKQTTEIEHLSLYDKFVSQATPEEWSVAFNVPQFDLDPEPLSNITPNADGSEIFQTIGGKASGVDPLITVTLKNSVAEY